MLDLNDLTVFERVASLSGFSAAARALALPKSSVSRSVARLEETVGLRLLHRSTRGVMLTEAGTALHQRCVDLLGRVHDAMDQMKAMTDAPRGTLKVGCGIGYGINVLSGLLPAFLERYPEVDIALDLSTSFSDMIANGIDVAIRLGPMPSSGLIAVRLHALDRHLCAAPAYLARYGFPTCPQDLVNHRAIEMPGGDGRPRAWSFQRDGQIEQVVTDTRVCVNEVLTIHRLVASGVGLGILTGYICRPMIAAGKVSVLLPEWSIPPVDVHLVFPSRRAMSPLVKAFTSYLKDAEFPV